MLRISLFLLCALGVAGWGWAQSAARTFPLSATPPAAGSSTAPTPTPSKGVAAPAAPYSATVPVAGTTDAARNTAMGTALAEVLQRVAPRFTASPQVLAGAAGYVRDYHYRRAPTGSGLELQVDFDPKAVGRLVHRALATSTAAASSRTPTAGSSSAAPSGAAHTPVMAVHGTGTLWVGGIDDSHAFASLLATLRGDRQLPRVLPIGAEGNGVLLQVDYRAPLPTVLAALETPTGHLQQAPEPHAGAVASLRWTP